VGESLGVIGGPSGERMVEETVVEVMTGERAA
jgi:hypothetical protein